VIVPRPLDPDQDLRAGGAGVRDVLVVDGPVEVELVDLEVGEPIRNFGRRE